MLSEVQAETSIFYSNSSILCFSQSAWSVASLLYTAEKSPLLALQRVLVIPNPLGHLSCLSGDTLKPIFHLIHMFCH